MHPRRARHLSRCAALALLAAACALGDARAQGGQGGDGRGVAEMLRAVVGVETEIGADARTAPTLGVQRSGSGIVIDASGLVATVGYLVLEARGATIVIDGERRIPATVVGYDHDSGLGLLRAEEALEVAPLALGESATLEPGAPLLVASSGGPSAVQPAVLVSRRTFAGYWEYLLEDPLYVAPAHPLFGGAALLDGEGRVVGVGSLAVSDAAGGQRALPGNVFIPVNLLKEVLADMLVAGRSLAPARPWLGVYADDARGPVTIRRIAVDGPAAAAGLEAGDVLVGVGEVPVATLEAFYRAVWASGVAGDTVPLTVLRANAIERIAVRSMDRYEWLRLPGR